VSFHLPLTFTAKLDDLAAIAFGRSASGRGSEIHHCLTFRRCFEPQFAALVSLAIQRLSDRRRTSHLAQQQNLHLKIATFSRNLQEVADPNIARRLGWLIIRLNLSQITGPPR
jgi:hypothetical protein